MKQLTLFLIAAALATVALGSPVLYTVSPDANGAPWLTAIDPAAQSVTLINALGDGSVAFDSGLSFSVPYNGFYFLGHDALGGGVVQYEPPDFSTNYTAYTYAASSPGGLTYDANDGYLYGVITDGNGNSTLNHFPGGCCTGPQLVTALGLGFNGGLTYNSSDTLLYGIANDMNGNSVLFKIDPVSHSVVQAMALGVGFRGGLVYDAQLGKFYAVSTDSFGYSTLDLVDAGNTTVTPLFGLGYGFTNAGLAIGPDNYPGSGVPEPSTAGLIAGGMVLLVLRAARARGQLQRIL